MGTRKTRSLPVCLERVQQRFERWRQTRKIPSRIPGSLWASAARIASTYGLSRTAKALRVPEECRHVLESLAVVYRNDAIAKQRGLSSPERLLWHQAESGPVMEDLRAWLARQLDEHRVEPNSTLGKAMTYLLRHWAKLTLFLRVPGAPLDNNICEQALKKAQAN